MVDAARLARRQAAGLAPPTIPPPLGEQARRRNLFLLPEPEDSDTPDESERS
ncbi:hypothetical protein ABZ208_13230 [Streptomyces sp. NPDC006208]|uniref:hypothetical protein n=1 Tax=Streptomyces sp. NPDC006208 TaxID=3156734 RepID=UPI0033A9D83B